MKRNEAIRIILGRCGNRINNAFLRDATVREMALVQETVLERAHFRPWFLMSERLRANTGVGEARMPLPPRYLEEHEEGLLWIRELGSKEWKKLERKDTDTLEMDYGNTDPRMPEAYDLTGKYFILYPTPDKTYELKIRCYQGQPTLPEAYDAAGAEDLTNLWLTHAADWVIGETGARIAGSYIKDRETAQEFAQEADRAKQSLYVTHVAREENNRDRMLGED